MGSKASKLSTLSPDEQRRAIYNAVANNYKVNLSLSIFALIFGVIAAAFAFYFLKAELNAQNYRQGVTENLEVLKNNM